MIFICVFLYCTTFTQWCTTWVNGESHHLYRKHRELISKPQWIKQRPTEFFWKKSCWLCCCWMKWWHGFHIPQALSTGYQTSINCCFFTRLTADLDCYFKPLISKLTPVHLKSQGFKLGFNPISMNVYFSGSYFRPFAVSAVWRKLCC